MTQQHNWLIFKERSIFVTLLKKFQDVWRYADDRLKDRNRILHHHRTTRDEAVPGAEDTWKLLEVPRLNHEITSERTSEVCLNIGRLVEVELGDACWRTKDALFNVNWTELNTTFGRIATRVQWVWLRCQLPRSLSCAGAMHPFGLCESGIDATYNSESRNSIDNGFFVRACRMLFNSAVSQNEWRFN